MVTLQMIQEAQESLKGIARKTPLENANRLGENIYIKSENLQLTGAFKIRGAYNKIRSLTPETNEKIRVIGDDVVDIKFDAELYKNSDRMSISVADDGTYTVTVKGLNSLTVK